MLALFTVTHTDTAAATITVSGEIDVANADALLDMWDAARADGRDVVVLDLRDVTLCDLHGLRVIERVEQQDEVVVFRSRAVRRLERGVQMAS